MDRFQLNMLSDNDLKQLFHDVKCEYSDRARKLRLKRIANKKTKHWNSFEELNRVISDRNSSGFYFIPIRGQKKYPAMSRYLPALLRQDWSSIYSGGDIEEKYYVYCHVDPRKLSFTSTKDAGGNYGGLPFYVGKGCGSRAFDLKRNQGHGKLIQSIFNDGYNQANIVKILFSEISEAKAFEIEAKLIYFFGTIYQKEKTGCLLNLDTPKTPEFIGVMEHVMDQCQWDNHEKQKNIALLPEVQI